MWWRQHSLEGKSGCPGIPASLSLDVAEVGGSDAPPAAQTCLQPPQVSLSDPLELIHGLVIFGQLIRFWIMSACCTL